MPGPARKPTALRVLEGNPSKRPLPKGEPKPRAGVPPSPESLTVLGKFAWDRAIEVMADVPGWLTQADWSLLERWAMDYAIWRDCVTAITAHGLTFERVTVDGAGQEQREVRARPELKTMNEASSRMLRAEAALGFGPAFRAKIALGSMEEGGDDDLDPA